MMMERAKSISAACSWSGGKDCCLALHRAAAEGIEVGVLLTMLTEDGKRSRSNGVSLPVIRAQASALDAHLLAYSTGWSDYERTFRSALEEARRFGAETIVFGDMRGAAHRRWNEEMCRNAGLAALLPLWEGDGIELLNEFGRHRYDARITAVNDECLTPDFVGRRVNSALIEELHARGLDPCGENGEYHTVVVDAPGFARRISVVFAAATLRRGYWHSEVTLAEVDVD